jgi:predicted nucleotidyltransferase
VNQLSAEQSQLLTLLTQRLGAIGGIQAVVLGGSYARGRAQPGSDLDLYLYYLQKAPFSIQSVCDLAESVNDTLGPVVTDFYGWGPWVNGGAWLTIGGQRVDFVYRDLEHLQRVIAEAEAGRYEFYAALPPFGFFSAVYLGEIAVCVPLFDPEAWLEVLRRRVAAYPEALRRAVVQDYLWAAELGLAAFAPKFAGRASAYGTAACLTRAVHQLLLVLFALNRRYLLDDKTALAEVAEFERVPREFGPRVQKALAHLGDSPAELDTAVESVAQLFR